jgi:beta-ureidopropionase
MSHRIRVASISMAQELRRPQCAEDNLRYVAEVVEELAPIRPDLVALPEIYPTAVLGGDDQRGPQDSALIQELARKYRTYMVGSMYLERDGRRYNTALVVDRDGEIVGRYDKVHPTEGEIAGGIAPGVHGQPPVETEVGTIGMQVCFDANWPRDWEGQAAAGADLVVFPSAFPAGRLIESLALTYGVFIVPSVWTLHSGIIDNTGRWVAKTDRFRRWAAATIDLERTVYHWDQQGQRIVDIVKKYGPRIHVETYGPEALFVLEPASEDVSIPEITREFGLITYRDYIARATAAQDVARGQSV